MKMRSLKTRITSITVAAVLISITAFGAIGIYFITRETNNTSGQNLNLICENRKDTLNDYLNSVEQSVGMISRYATDSLDGVALTEGGVLGADGSSVYELKGRSETQRKELDSYLEGHLKLIENAFRSVANHTGGIDSCYYRLNPEITGKDIGFFYSKKDSADFVRLELTDLKAYEPDDMSHVGWYYVPLKKGRPSWTEPYDNAKLDEMVISYVVPIYKSGTFVGVLGMDIAYDTLIEQIQQFSNFESGFFALTDKNGVIYYHPEYEMGTETMAVLPQLAEAVKDMDLETDRKSAIRYSKNGEKWQMTYSALSNGMILVAVVKNSEINASLYNLEKGFIVSGILILVVFIVITTFVMRRVTIPLTSLAKAARRLADGDYDVDLDYKSDDEVGVLVESFSGMRDRLKINISDLSDKAFKDDLTGVKSKHAHVEAEDELDELIKNKEITEFAVAIFDLNDLKRVTASKGHEAGDEYIKEGSRIICERFKRSPVYRIGGDEFVAILRGADYAERDDLLAAFERQMDENVAKGEIAIASGSACFDPADDRDYHTVFRRADEVMYIRKKAMKEQSKEEL